MSRRVPFPFRDHIRKPLHVSRSLLDMFVKEYEEQLVAEYGAGDVDAASYAEGKRQAYEEVLVTLLDVPTAEMTAYWGRTDRPDPATHDLPSPSAVLVTYDQVEAWSGQRLTAEQWDALDEAIPNSSIPEAVATIVGGLSRA